MNKNDSVNKSSEKFIITDEKLVILFTYAYETIDFLKKYAVTPNLEKYVIEENITG